MRRLETLRTYRIPAMMAGKEYKIVVDVVDSGIPLLMSKKSMARAEMRIDYGTNEIEIGGRRVEAFETTTGHLCVKLHPNIAEISVEMEKQ